MLVLKNKIERITNLDCWISKHFLLILFFIVSFYVAGGQQILFRNYDVQNGLSSNTVWNVLQDDQGFIWLGTKNGLNRFDGYCFKLHPIKQKTSEGLLAFHLPIEQFKGISFTNTELILMYC